MSIVEVQTKREKYNRPSHARLLRVASEITERRRGLIICLAGTSGTGKSTLASILADRLGIHTVVSTDSIRHQLRQDLTREEHPFLFSSTYESDSLVGYQRQCEPVQASLCRLLEGAVASHESMVVEGVHLDMEFLTSLMAKHDCVVPFLVYISNETKHYERFAVRSKYMTLHAPHNKYLRHFEQIRTIQDHLVDGATERMVPKIDNTNVDRSVAAIHSVIVRCLHHLACGEQLFDPEAGKAVIMHREYRKARKHAWSSKAMQAVIRQKPRKKRVLLPPSDDEASLDSPSSTSTTAHPRRRRVRAKPRPLSQTLEPLREDSAAEPTTLSSVVPSSQFLLSDRGDSDGATSSLSVAASLHLASSAASEFDIISDEG